MPLPRPIPGTGSAHTISAIIADALIFIGVAVFAASIRNFSRAGTPVQGTRPTRTPVTTGIHGWSRNPIYLAMLVFIEMTREVKAAALGITIHDHLVMGRKGCRVEERPSRVRSTSLGTMHRLRPLTI